MSQCTVCGVVGLSAQDVDLAREILGEGWDRMCIECAKSYATESKKFSAIQMILNLMNDGSRIDRYLKRNTDGKFYTTDDSEGGIKIPVCHDSNPTEKDAEHFINLLGESE